jgi:hypothetical protein
MVTSVWPANAVLSNLSGGQDYTRGFAPVWTTAVLGAVAVPLSTPTFGCRLGPVALDQP